MDRKWVVTVTKPGSLRPVQWEHFQTEKQANSRAKQMREQIKRRGWAHKIRVGEVIEAIQA